MYALKNSQLHFIGIPTIAIVPLLLSSSDRSLQVNIISTDSSINPPGLRFAQLDQKVSQPFGFLCLFSFYLSNSLSLVRQPKRRLCDFILAKSAKPMLCLSLQCIGPYPSNLCHDGEVPCHHKLLAIVATSMYFCTHHDGEVLLYGHHDGEVRCDAVLLN